MPKLHNPDLWPQSDPRPYRTIDSGSEGGSSDPEPKDPPHGNPDGGRGKDDPGTSKEFSHALAKRVAEIEKKYEAKLKDYEQLKKKADAYDEQQESGKSDMDRLNERLAAIEAERDKLAAEKQRHELVSRVAKETGLPSDVLAMLSADDEEGLKAAAETLKEQFGKTGRRGAPPAGHSDGRTPKDDRHGMDLLRDAYSN